jgi:hypothetical protein
LKDWDNQSTPLIHSHFAQLHGQEKNFVLMNDGSVQNTLGPWKPCSVFPKLQDDLLLYLLLMGGKSYSAFYATDGNQVPYSHFLMHVNDNLDHRSHILDHSNALQKCNDGMFLESLLCSTVCLASHSNGIEGIRFQPFLLNLVYHLQIEELDLTQITVAGLEHLNGFSFDVPFLSPPNQAWPDELNIPGMKLGFLERTTNLKKIDLWASCGLSGEAKDYGSEINLETMRQILKRIPEEAKVELVFTRKLQNSYFNFPAQSFATEFERTHLLQKAFYKIDASKPNTLLESIKGLPSASATTKAVVIFFEINCNLLLLPFDDTVLNSIIMITTR